MADDESAARATDGTTDDGLTTIAGGAGLVFGGRIVKLAFAFGLQVVMARFLGPAAYGSVVLAMAVGAIGNVLADLGLTSGLVRNLPYYEDDPKAARGVVKGSLQLGTISGTFAAVVTFVLAPTIVERFFDDPSLVLLVRLAAISSPFVFLGNAGIAIARGSRSATTHVVVKQLLSPVASVVFVGTLLLTGFGAVGAIVGLTLTSILSAGVALWLARRALSFRFRGPTTRMYGPLLGFSLPLLFAAGMDFVVVHTDTFVIGTFLAPGSVGVYNVVFQLRDVGMLFFYPLTFLLPPVLTRLMEKDERREARRVYQVASKWSVLLTTPVFLAVFLFPEVVISLTFGENYLGGALTLRVLSLPVMVTVLLSANGTALIALGHNRINLYVNAGVALLNVVLNAVLVPGLGPAPQLGIVGAAVASAVAYVVRDLVFTVALYRWESIHPFSAAMLRPYLASLVLASVSYAVFAQVVVIGPATVIAAGVIFLAIYAPFVVVCGALESEDGRLLAVVENRTGSEFTSFRSIVGRLRG